MKNRRLCIVIHDVAPATWPVCSRMLKVLAAIDDFPVTLLVVPHAKGEARDERFEQWLRYRAGHGDDLALQGPGPADGRQAHAWLDRLRLRLNLPGGSALCEWTFAQTKSRTQSGLDWLMDVGVAPAGLVVPAWWLNEGSWRALCDSPLEYACTLRGVVLLPEMHSMRCRSQTYNGSTPWRRRLSILWNETLARLHRQANAIRLDLHPRDTHRTVRRSWQRLVIEQSLTREVCTLRDLADELRRSSSGKPTRQNR